MSEEGVKSRAGQADKIYLNWWSILRDEKEEKKAAEREKERAMALKERSPETPKTSSKVRFWFILPNLI